MSSSPGNPINTKVVVRLGSFMFCNFLLIPIPIPKPSMTDMMIRIINKSRCRIILHHDCGVPTVSTEASISPPYLLSCEFLCQVIPGFGCCFLIRAARSWLLVSGSGSSFLVTASGVCCLVSGSGSCFLVSAPGSCFLGSGSWLLVSGAGSWLMVSASGSWLSLSGAGCTSIVPSVIVKKSIFRCLSLLTYKKALKSSLSLSGQGVIYMTEKKKIFS